MDGNALAGLVLSMSTLSAKGIECIDWPDPPLNSTGHVWDLLQNTCKFSASSTTDAG